MITISRRVYIDKALNYIEGMSASIERYASTLGLTPSVVAGALAEEADSYYTASAIHQGGDTFEDLITKYFESNPSIQLDYERVINAGIINEKTRLNDLVHPTMRDVGPCNIRVAVAIQLVQNYFAQNPSNPMNLDFAYETDYVKLVKDLAYDPADPAQNGQPQTGLAAAVAALALKQSQDYFTQYADPTYWNGLPQETRDAIVITAYNNGLEKIEAGRQGQLKAFGTYKPVPGGGESGGLDHENNAATIAATLGISGYGGKLSYPLEILGTAGTVAKAKQDDAEGMAYRYALLNFDPLVSPSRDLSAYNIHGELELSNFTDQYLLDRSNAFQSFALYTHSVNTNGVIAGFNLPFNEATIVRDLATGMRLRTHP